MGPNLENTTNLLKTMLERLEADELPFEVIREITSLLLQNFDIESYLPILKSKDNLKKLLLVMMIITPIMSLLNIFLTILTIRIFKISILVSETGEETLL